MAAFTKIMFDIKINEINNTSVPNEGSFLQTPFWAEFKSNHGWTHKRFLIEIKYNNEEEQKSVVKQDEVSVLSRSICKNIFSIAYIPLYPSLLFPCSDCDFSTDTSYSNNEIVIKEELVTPETQSIEFATLMQEIALKLQPFLNKNTMCVRFDPNVDFDNPEDRDLFNYGLKLISFADRLKLKKNNVDIQPPDSTLINLTSDEESILNLMKPKWRYNIKLASKKGVKIERILGNNINLSTKLDIFYDLYQTTAKRDGISIHQKSYYRDLLEKSSKEIDEGKDVPVISLYLASNEDDYLGAIITLFSKTESVYLYGCSSNIKRNLMPNFLLQWTAMRDAKLYGSKYYDMYGMPPTDDENHPMHGLYLFKTGFGGKNIHRCGTYDVQLNFVSSLFNLAETLRAFWHKKILKIIRGR